MVFLFWLQEGLRNLGGGFWPPGKKPGAHARGNSLRWLVHFLILAGILAGLTYLNYYFDLARALRSPWPALHPYWLPLLFLLVYLLCWPFYGLWKELVPSGSFADIDSAWKQGLSAMRQAGIDIAQTPLYLVMGRTAGPPAAYLEEAGTSFSVRLSSSQLHLYANGKGIYVWCPEASLLGRQAEFQGPGEEAGPSPAVQDILVRARKEGRGPNQLTPLEKQQIRALVTREQEPAAPAPRRIQARVRNQELAGACLGRLERLCKLIARSREPYCPVNGILLLIPPEASAGDADASLAATLCQYDLQGAREFLGVDCPIIPLACDLDQLPGFQDFAASMSQEDRKQALGVRFPLVPDLESAAIPAMIAGGLRWWSLSWLPAMVNNHFQTDGSDEAVRANLGMFRFMDEMAARCRRLSFLFSRMGVGREDNGSMLAGCFLAGISRHGKAIFVEEVFREIRRHKNHVVWTPKALAREKKFRRLIQLTWAGTVILVLALTGLKFLPY